MIDHVVVPYSDFLERRERRLRVAAELTRRDVKRTIESGVRAAVAGTRPIEPNTERAASSPSISSVDRVQ